MSVCVAWLGPSNCPDALVREQVTGQRRTRQAPSPLATLEMQKRGTQYLRIPGMRRASGRDGALHAVAIACRRPSQGVRGSCGAVRRRLSKCVRYRASTVIRLGTMQQHRCSAQPVTPDQRAEPATQGCHSVQRAHAWRRASLQRSGSWALSTSGTGLAATQPRGWRSPRLSCPELGSLAPPPCLGPRAPSSRRAMERGIAAAGQVACHCCRPRA